LELRDSDQRAPALAEHQEIVKQRATPAIFIVDGSLNVLFHRGDPHERRSDCVFHADTRRLPTLIERTVRALVDDRDPRHPEQILSAAPNASIAVRVVALAGWPEHAYAVLVERFKTRANLRAFVERYALSKREHEALALIVQGAKNSEIASRMQIAESTAIFHVKRLMSKAGARNRTELVAKIVG
jgi:DNA-binding CsgD family transcriptional regulator